MFYVFQLPPVSKVQQCSRPKELNWTRYICFLSQKLKEGEGCSAQNETMGTFIGTTGDKT